MEDLQEIWPYRWISPKAKSYNSPIDKLGVIAVENISKGENVGVLGGLIIQKSEIKKYWNKMGHVGIQIDNNFFIVPASRDELKKIGVFNHSCNPNCGFDGSIKLIAIENIKKGEELTFDYAFCESYNEEFKCKCKSINCEAK